ncbi:MAG TPA: ABC transporter substrate-binding protein [Alphaproteobacteria bacterium]|jgi:NitT/TauT family transport system substrate-binding protein
MTVGKMLLFASILAAAAAGSAIAEEKIKVAIGQRQVWDSQVIPLGVEAGIFKKHGLEIDITWTAGGAETLQAALTGSVDYALTNGVEGVLAAYAKGAPVRIIGSEMRGAGDIYWYVKADSPIKTLKDAEGKTMSFSRPGSSSNLTAQQLAAKAGVTVKLVSTGGMPVTRTQLVSGQIDIAWAAVPFALDAIKKGEFRIVARGSDLANLNDVSIRVNVTTAAFLKDRAKAAQAFSRAYKESVDWMYANLDKSAEYWAKLTKITPELAKDGIAFYPKERLVPWPISGLDHSIAEAVKAKRLEKPLTPEQIKELVVEIK